MTSVNFEALNDIEKLLESVNYMKTLIESGVVDKRWLNTRELAHYTGYKFETVQTKIKKGEFTKNVHYFKKGGMLLFDKTEVDNWVMGKESLNNPLYTKKQSDKTNKAIEDIEKFLIA